MQDYLSLVVCGTDNNSMERVQQYLTPVVCGTDKKQRGKCSTIFNPGHVWHRQETAWKGLSNIYPRLCVAQTRNSTERVQQYMYLSPVVWCGTERKQHGKGSTIFILGCVWHRQEQHGRGSTIFIPGCVVWLRPVQRVADTAQKARVCSHFARAQRCYAGRRPAAQASHRPGYPFVYPPRALLLSPPPRNK